ncbi:hypothetical protein AU210_016343 [Fusarium oxysporum f. sp. radicis-cucumerinum]|uniref:Uncharacterized protein n=1 Tax=Fusarium oxysporum f. sp. radicis-cucumerinum TaxID=327505 RepID=A0A2H3G0B7_FUSOX|nr:hypothetical protein AU210_016343 [Fusarium oxysporum f. sp. radicis-cucumerinum]
MSSSRGPPARLRFLSKDSTNTFPIIDQLFICEDTLNDTLAFLNEGSKLAMRLKDARDAIQGLGLSFLRGDSSSDQTDSSSIDSGSPLSDTRELDLSQVPPDAATPSIDEDSDCDEPTAEHSPSADESTNDEKLMASNKTPKDVARSLGYEGPMLRTMRERNYDDDNAEGRGDSDDETSRPSKRQRFGSL